MTQKIIKIGTSAGIIIPKTSLEKMSLKVGDTIALDLVENKGEIILRTPRKTGSKSDEEIGQIALGIIEKYRGDFKALADK